MRPTSKAHESNEVAVVAPRGRITAGRAAEEFGAEAVRLLENGRLGLVIDLTGVDRIDSNGLGVLVRICALARQLQARVVIMGWTMKTHGALRLARLLAAFELAGSREQAVFACVGSRTAG